MQTLQAQIDLERIIGRAADRAMHGAGRRSSMRIDEKSAGQFASTADFDIETFIRADLSEHFQGDAIIGEEQGGGLGVEDTGWAIDPIDGTTNFILGLPVWGISIGFVAHGESQLGAIVLPESQLMISALRGHCVRVNGASANLRQRVPHVKMIALGENDFEPGPETDARAQTIRDAGFAVVKHRCAVFSLVHSALGGLGGYIENGCGLWDIAAADVICREAGMVVESRQIADGRYFIDARWPLPQSL